MPRNSTVPLRGQGVGPRNGWGAYLCSSLLCLDGFNGLGIAALGLQRHLLLSFKSKNHRQRKRHGTASKTPDGARDDILSKHEHVHPWETNASEDIDVGMKKAYQQTTDSTTNHVPGKSLLVAKQDAVDDGLTHATEGIGDEQVPARGSTLLALSAQAIGERDGKRGVGYNRGAGV